MTEHITDFYVRLTYSEYKEMERQLRNLDEIESSHTSVEGFYHKAIRLRVGTALFEFQGPTVKQPYDQTLL